MKTMKVYQWLLDNLMFIAAPALVNKFGLTGELQQEVILDLLGAYFRNPSGVLRAMRCDVTTTLTF